PWRAAYRPRPGTYRDACDFLTDLRLLESSLRAHGGPRLADGRLGTLLAQAEIFGFHLATLDLRQHAERHTSALAEVFARYELGGDYAQWTAERREGRLTGERLSPRPLPGRPPASTAQT